MTHSTIPPSTAVLAYVLLRLPQVQARTGLSRTEIYRRIAAGTFPQNVKIGPRASAWVELEISEYCAALIATRDARKAA